MIPREVLQRLWRWRVVVVAGLLLGAAVGWISAPGAVGRAVGFQATHSLLLDPAVDDASLINRTVALAVAGAVPVRVAGRLGVDRSVVRSSVSAETRDNLGLLLITARSSDGERAEALADVTAEELLVELGGPSAPLRTLEPAVAAPVAEPGVEGPRSRPSRALLLAAFGVVIGVVAAMGIDRFDIRIRSKRSAEEALGIPVVAEVPAIAGAGGSGVLLTRSGSSSLVQSYHPLATFLDRSRSRLEGGGRHRVVAVTSAGVGEGRTTTVAYLAAALGELGRSVLVISADLRRPRLHAFFQRPAEPGLVDVLQGEADLENLDLRTPVRGVSFLGSGTVLENPGPLLDGAGGLFRAARRLADLVLVDTPPLLTVSDAAEVARHADDVILVIRAGYTTTRAAARSAELLELLGVPLLGAVLVGGQE